jgi:hypothetical protein
LLLLLLLLACFFLARLDHGAMGEQDHVRHWSYLCDL